MEFDMHQLKTKLREFLGNRRGVAATEFALVMPLMAIMVFGGFATFKAVQAAKAVDRSSAVVSDLTSRLSTVDDETIDSLLAISESLLGDAVEQGSHELVLTSVSNKFDSKDEYELSIDWSFSNIKGKKHTVNDLSRYDIPYIPEGESVILTDLSMTYSPLSYAEHFGQMDFTQVSTRRPRFVPLVVYVGE